MNASNPPVGADQAAALDQSAQATGAPRDVGQVVLPCQSWQLKVTVESTAPFHPDKAVSVAFRITSGGDGYGSERTMMDGPKSPPVDFKGRSTFTYALTGSSEKWVNAAGATVALSPRIEPYAATVKIKPEKPWAIIKVMDAKSSALLPRFDVGLKLGDATKKTTTAEAKPALFQELMTASSDGQVTTSANATEFAMASLGHPDEVWEFVSIASE